MPINPLTNKWVPLSENQWIPNGATKFCQILDAITLKRCSRILRWGNRHHCRECGKLVCDQHSRNRYHEYRVCDGCYNILSKKLHSLNFFHKTLVYSSTCCYKTGIKYFSTITNIKIQEINSPDEWVRDYVLETAWFSNAASKKIYLRNKNSCYANYLVERNKKPYQLDKDNWYPIQNAERRFTSTGASDYIHSTNRTSEGGNLFLTRNAQGVNYLIMGEGVIETEKLLAIEKNGTSAQEADIIKKYKKIFHADNILILPNIIYHLDLFMCVVKEGTIFINDFFVGISEFKSQTIIFNRLRSVVEAKQQAIQDTAALLLQHGFIVERVAGILYDPSSKIRIWDGTGVSSSFMNGIHFYKEHSKLYYYLTTNSADTRHKLYFANLLKKYGVQVIYINADNMNARETSKNIERNSGGLRCQTAWVNANRF